MARAYIVLTRNDLDDNLLQVLDLSPNSSQRNSVYDPAGQTHYQTHFYTDGVNGDVEALGGVTNAIFYGLSTYLKCRIANTAGGGLIGPLPDADCILVANEILTRAAAGSPLTAADINASILAATGNANGIGIGNSDATVEEILRILAGERFRVDRLTDIGAGNFWQGPGLGFFTTAPSATRPESVFANNGAGVRGKNPFVGPTIPTSIPVQVGTQDVNHNSIIPIVDTGALRLSALSGQLSEMASAGFTFLNPNLTYGSGGTALDLGGSALPASGAGRAVTVYAADGTVIA